MDVTFRGASNGNIVAPWRMDTDDPVSASCQDDQILLVAIITSRFCLFLRVHIESFLIIVKDARAPAAFSGRLSTFQGSTL